jgi:4'-phosphopantetheinyl transferase
MSPGNNSISNYRVAKEIVIDSSVQVFLLSVNDNIPFINHAIIPAGQQADISRYHFSHDRNKRLLTRSFLYEYLAVKYGVADFELEFNEYKKPSLRSAPGIQFSFSYSKEYVLIGISEGKKLGIDIEYTDRSVPVTEMADDIMCADELRHFQTLNKGTAEQFHFFFHVFSAKESIIKSFGTGLYFDVKKINTLSGDRFKYLQEQFRYHDAGLWMGEYQLAVCHGPD